MRRLGRLKEIAMAKNDGGPEPMWKITTHGWTYRQWLVGQALNALIGKQGNSGFTDITAESAVQYADACIAALEGESDD